MDFIHKPVSPGPLQSCRCHTRERCFTSSVGARDGDITTCTDTEQASGVDTRLVHVALHGKLVSVLGSFWIQPEIAEPHECIGERKIVLAATEMIGQRSSPPFFLFCPPLPVEVFKLVRSMPANLNDAMAHLDGREIGWA